MHAHALGQVQLRVDVKNFHPGDTVKVAWRTKEGDRERIQNTQGVVVRIRNAGPATSLTVRRIASGVGMERQFPLSSPLLHSIEIIRQGNVRRAKLFYLRGLTGRAARIKERGRLSGTTMMIAQSAAEAEEAAATEPVGGPEAAPEAAAPEQAASEKPAT